MRQKVNAGNYRLWKQVGYMVEMPHAYPDITVAENIEITRRLRGLDDRNAVPQRVMEKLQLMRYQDHKTKTFCWATPSGHGLAKALIHHPAILILDESNNGFDPAGIVEIWQLLLDIARNDGVTVFNLKPHH